MLFAVLFFICQIIFGFLIFDFFDPKRKFNCGELIASAFLLGPLLSSFMVLLGALMLHSLFLGILFFFLLFLLFLLFRFKYLRTLFFSIMIDIKSFLKKRRFFSKTNIWLFLLIFILIVYSFFLSTVLFKEKNGTLRAPLMAWGDTATHIDLIKKFSTTDPFNLDNPMMGGVNLTYHFMIDFISGIFHKLGADLILSYRLPLYTFGIAAFLLVFAFSYRILKSKNLAILALIFILWGSGLGSLVLFKDLDKSYQEGGLGGIYQLIKNPPHEYTRTSQYLTPNYTQDNIAWIVPVISFFGHQRSGTIGLAVFTFVLLGIYYYGREKEFWRFGITAGLLPFSNSNSLLALFFLLGTLFWFFLMNWRSWFKFAFITFLLVLPQIIFYIQGNKIFNFLKPWFGWMSCSHPYHWFFCGSFSTTILDTFLFWIKNFGVVFVVWILSGIGVIIFLCIPFLRKRVINYSWNLRLFFASCFLFIIPNFFIFQPWNFDNGKVFFYWWLLAIICVIIPLLKFLWERMFIGKIIVILLIFFGTIAGVFDFTSWIINAKGGKVSGYSDSIKGNVEMAQWIKNNTSPNSIFLTHPWIDSVPIFLAGRPVYMGFEGWLWGIGLNSRPNRATEQKILQGDIEEACKKNINYILLNNELKKSFPTINIDLLLKKTQTVFQQKTIFDEQKILKINCKDYNN